MCAQSKVSPKGRKTDLLLFPFALKLKPQTLLVFERVKTEYKPSLMEREALNQRCTAYSAEGSSGPVSTHEPGQNCALDSGRVNSDAVNLA